MAAFKDFPLLSEADLIQTLALLCGVGPGVAALLEGRVVSPGPTLATLLRQRRAKMGISKRIVAQLSRITHTQITLYEEQGRIPGLLTICKMAQGYGIPAVLIIMASLNTAGLLRFPAPGAKITPRCRTRMRVRFD